jgi:hypothetical protein
LIQITSKMWMDNDEENWIIGKRYKDNRNGKYYLKDMRFFSNITNALSWVMDQELKDSRSVQELLSRVKELRESLATKTDFIQR